MSQATPSASKWATSYDHLHATDCLQKHEYGLTRRIAHWRDEQQTRRALKLAGDPDMVLDLPCGTGRFWALLAEQPNRLIFAADDSTDSLENAEAAQPLDVLKQVESFQSSACAIEMDDNFVDSILCMDLLHQIADPAQRLLILREFHRVTRDTLIVSLKLDDQALTEAQFDQAGFDILDHSNFLPGYALWRVYVLRKRTQA
ncbi:class I SAM-dependent methyltransferase [Pseudomonas sp.]|uniref:class I SAM-dependent methyltransferase n=1 Tax=Pseudomonas sp. TaxID=306 RepID=UPI003C789FD4